MSETYYSTKLSGHKKCINGIDLSYSDTLLASASDDCSVRIWDTRSCRVTKSISKCFSAPVDVVLFDSRSEHAIFCSSNTSIYSFDLRSDAVILTESALSVEGLTQDTISAMSQAPSGGQIAVCDDAGDVQILDIADRACSARFPSAHSSIGSAVCWTTDKTVLSGGFDCTANMWDCASRASIFSLNFSDMQVQTGIGAPPSLNPPYVHSIAVLDRDSTACALGDGSVSSHLCHCPTPHYFHYVCRSVPTPILSNYIIVIIFTDPRCQQRRWIYSGLESGRAQRHGYLFTLCWVISSLWRFGTHFVSLLCLLKVMSGVDRIIKAWQFREVTVDDILGDCASVSLNSSTMGKKPDTGASSAGGGGISAAAHTNESSSEDEADSAKTAKVKKSKSAKKGRGKGKGKGKGRAKGTRDITIGSRDARKLLYSWSIEHSDKVSALAASHSPDRLFSCPFVVADCSSSLTLYSL